MSGLCFSPACLAAALVLTNWQAHAAPAFVPVPSRVYDGFVAINGPRAEVPVGALWIDGYGPHGEGAAADNLQTERGLSGMVISRDLHLSLTAGLLDVLGIDPGMRQLFQARFTDLSIVRVKDIGRLSGPSGEPRIIEVLKAGTVLVTTDKEVALDLDRRSVGSPFTARLDSGSKRGFTIEGKDMVIAMRVASVQPVSSRPELIKFEVLGERLVGEAHNLNIVANLAPCASEEGTSCPKPLLWRFQRSGKGQAADATQTREPTSPLPVPRADGRGGLYDSARLEPVAPCARSRAKGCGGGWRAWLILEGSNVVDLARPRAPRW